MRNPINVISAALGLLAFGSGLTSAQVNPQASPGTTPLYQQLQQGQFPTKVAVPDPPDPNFLYRKAIEAILENHLGLASKDGSSSGSMGPTNYSGPYFMFKNNYGEPPAGLKTLADADKAIRTVLQELKASPYQYRWDGYVVPDETKVNQPNQTAHADYVDIGETVAVKGQSVIIQDLLAKNASAKEAEAALTISNERPLLLTPIPCGPAAQAGLLKGDAVLEVDGMSTASHTMMDVRDNMIAGPDGQNVELVIERQENGVPVKHTFTVARKAFAHPAATLEDLGDGVFYLKYDNFMHQGGDSEVEGCLNMMAEAKGKKLIFDLRQNGGGLVQYAINIAANMIPEGEVVVLEERNPKTNQLIHERWHAAWNALMQFNPEADYIVPHFQQRSLCLAPDVQVVFLVDGGTVSASEILVGAVVDNLRGRAKVVGESTLGKNETQAYVQLPYGREIHVTNSRFYPAGCDAEIHASKDGTYPAGRDNYFIGYQPDVVVHHVIGSGVDEQLEAAKKLVNTMWNDFDGRAIDEELRNKLIRDKKRQEWDEHLKKQAAQDAKQSH